MNPDSEEFPSEKNMQIKKALKSFLVDFKYASSLGFIPSHRFHDTGIGKTFEDLMKIEENNSHLPDYEDIIELKSQRNYTGSMLTLFTLIPSFPKNANKLIKDNYGMYHEKYKDIKTILTTICNSKFNNFKEKWRFKLNVNRENQILELLIKNFKSDKKENVDIYWAFSDLKNKIMKKLMYVAYVLAKTRKRKDKEEFHFNKAILLTGITFERFLDSIEKDIIKFDLRIGVYGSGIKEGQSHDHGSGFRIFKKDIKNLFTVKVFEEKPQSTIDHFMK